MTIRTRRRGRRSLAAILVNGGDASLAEAMMVGPIAARLQLPVLLTAADELPMATSDFIEAEDIEHVIIVGGTDSALGRVVVLWHSADSDAPIHGVTHLGAVGGPVLDQARVHVQRPVLERVVRGMTA